MIHGLNKHAVTPGLYQDRLNYEALKTCGKLNYKTDHYKYSYLYIPGIYTERAKS